MTAGAGDRQAQRVVALARAVGQEPAALRAIGVGGESLSAQLVGRWRGPEIDPLDVLRHIEQ